MFLLRPRWVLLLVVVCAAATAAYAAGANRQPAARKPVASKPTKPQRTPKIQRAMALTPAPVGVAPAKAKGDEAPSTDAQPSADSEPTTLDPKVAADAQPDPTSGGDEAIEPQDADEAPQEAPEAATEESAPPKKLAKHGLSPLIVAAKPVGPNSQGDRFDLQYKFQPNEIVRTEVIHRATVETTIKGTTQTAETRTTSIKIWHISPGSTETQFAIIHGVESIDMWQHTKGREEVQYNSLTDKTPPPGYEDVAKAVGVPLTEVTMDSHGKVLKRKEVHLQSNANPAPLTMPLPEKPVAIGESWTHPLELDVLLTNGSTKKISTRQKFTLEGVTSGIATIHVDTDALVSVNDPAIEAQLIQRMPSGTIRFDIDAGRVVFQQMDVDKRVIGFNGPASSMHFLSRFTEEFKSATDATAVRPRQLQRR